MSKAGEGTSAKEEEKERKKAFFLLFFTQPRELSYVIGRSFVAYPWDTEWIKKKIPPRCQWTTASWTSIVERFSYLAKTG